MRERQDFAAMLDEIGIDDAVIQQDMAKFPVVENEDPNIYLAPSAIHGTGLFVRHLEKGRSILGAFDHGRTKTIAGRYANHSPTPNAYMERRGSDIVCVAMRDLHNEEVTLNYRDSFAVKAIQGV